MTVALRTAQPGFRICSPVAGALDTSKVFLVANMPYIGHFKITILNLTQPQIYAVSHK